MQDFVTFGFRPWVRRAGLSIVIVAGLATLAIAGTIAARPEARYGWLGEPFVWVYIGTLWLGGLKVFLGTLRPVAEIGDDRIVVRPLHQMRQNAVPWDAVRGTEQMIGGDRLIIFFDTPRGQRFVAMNLNLVKGRKDFMAVIEERLRARGFGERVVERSRYLARP
jgi:hypothetical protein